MSHPAHTQKNYRLFPTLHRHAWVRTWAPAPAKHQRAALNGKGQSCESGQPSRMISSASWTSTRPLGASWQARATRVSGERCTHHGRWSRRTSHWGDVLSGWTGASLRSSLRARARRHRTQQRHRPQRHRTQQRRTPAQNSEGRTAFSRSLKTASPPIEKSSMAHGSTTNPISPCTGSRVTALGAVRSRHAQTSAADVRPHSTCTTSASTHTRPMRLCDAPLGAMALSAAEPSASQTATHALRISLWCAERPCLYAQTLR